jgi:hypothetical protein
MPMYLTNKGLARIAGGVSGSTDIRAAVFSDTGTLTKAIIQDLNSLADLEAVASVAEVTNTGYARFDLAGVTVTVDDTGNQVTITATAPTSGAITAGDTWRRIAYYIEGASDAARDLLAVDIPAAGITPNGGAITLPALSITVTDPTA